MTVYRDNKMIKKKKQTFLLFSYNVVHYITVRRCFQMWRITGVKLCLKPGHVHVKEQLYMC